MGRKSLLTEKQWAEIERRLLEGEPQRKLAREFGISESALRGKVSARVKQIKAVANQIVSTERAVMELPIAAQITAHNLASKLRSISDNMASAADLAAATSLRIQAIANSHSQKIDDSDPMAGNALREVAAMLSVANEAAKTPLNLLAANKEAISSANSPADAPSGLNHFYGE